MWDREEWGISQKARGFRNVNLLPWGKYKPESLSLPSLPSSLLPSSYAFAHFLRTHGLAVFVQAGLELAGSGIRLFQPPRVAEL